MTHADWRRAMLDEPVDDLARLAYADWLEDRGEANRAAYVRLGVETGRLGYGDPARRELVQRTGAAFERCRPDYWAPLAGVEVQHDRGLVDLCVGTRTALTRVGRTAWVGRAVADGWVGAAFLNAHDFGPAWAGAVAAAWRNRLAGAALKVHCWKPRPAAADLLFARPELHTLLTSVAAFRPGLERVAAGHAGLRELSVSLDDFSPAGPERVAAALACAARFLNLRRLALNSNQDRPTDADLLALAAAPGLRRLGVHSSPAVTAAGVDAARAAFPHLTIDFTPT